MTEQTSVSRTSVKPSETKADKDKFPVRLLKNYMPIGEHEIVGHHRPAVVQKNAAGQMVVIEPAAFVEGVMTEPEFAGAGCKGKVWANTVIRLPIEEAKRAISLKIAERADALPG